ncbi:CBS domain-containing protein [Plastoroseomonas arctica]|uniref:CBS domain-containing protein n=1 Tax=Plastoroseomonas arctica TaxID=1509237 RepID=A0AAF1JVP6_9PROT|nr:CBS domain-containing protein [Plastoroseomonas arctica]MBR0654727.1 CBS domain-containing protein [Plastoroseomonas arctica]
MTIASILARKGGNVVSVGPGEDAVGVAATLARHRIGAVLVRDGAGVVLGILSERDIVRAIGKDGTAALAMTARQMMTSDVHSVSPDTGINEALGEMTDRRIRHLPVMTAGTVAGMVSIGDLVKARMDAIIEEAESLRAFVTAS